MAAYLTQPENINTNQLSPWTPAWLLAPHHLHRNWMPSEASPRGSAVCQLKLGSCVRPTWPRQSRHQSTDPGESCGSQDACSHGNWSRSGWGWHWDSWDPFFSPNVVMGRGCWACSMARKGEGMSLFLMLAGLTYKARFQPFYLPFLSPFHLVPLLHGTCFSMPLILF